MVSRTRHYKTRIRSKGQVTIPNQVREMLNLEEGDGLIFYVHKGRVVIEREQTVDPEQAWFWSERWQEAERAAQADIDAGRVHEFSNIDDALAALGDSPEDAED